MLKQCCNIRYDAGLYNWASALYFADISKRCFDQHNGDDRTNQSYTGRIVTVSSYLTPIQPRLLFSYTCTTVDSYLAKYSTQIWLS